MIRKAKRAWFEVWGNEKAQNQILKLLLLVFGFANSICAISLVYLATKSPALFAVSSVESGMLRNNPPPKEYLVAEATRVVTSYLQSRHSWNASDVRGSIGKASRFIDESFRKSFLSANEAQIRIAQDKKISQKFYVSKIEVDLAKETASVSGDRILTVDGFRAVNALSFNLTLRLGERTEQNPEGVYITSEQLIDLSKEVK
ncbi:MAG: TraE/TraK family type IV conjugative transfer system protein [Bdellovibrionales bacterium]|nr:TraE/TraK family type IV conjugative transfer system protein [Bdellovibrionales bacterium]